MNYWILQHNPAILPVGDTNYPGQVPANLDYWRIRNHTKHVKKDDQTFIWYSNTNKAKRGIYNIAQIVSVEPHSPEAQRYIMLMWESDRLRYNPIAYARLGQYPAILIRRQYPSDFDPHISLDELKNADFADFPAVYAPYQWGIRWVDPETGERLMMHIQKTRGR